MHFKLTYNTLCNNKLINTLYKVVVRTIILRLWSDNDLELRLEFHGIHMIEECLNI